MCSALRPALVAGEHVGQQERALVGVREPGVRHPARAPEDLLDLDAVLGRAAEGRLRRRGPGRAGRGGRARDGPARAARREPRPPRTRAGRRLVSTSWTLPARRPRPPPLFDAERHLPLGRFAPGRGDHDAQHVVAGRERVERDAARSTCRGLARGRAARSCSGVTPTSRLPCQTWACSVAPARARAGRRRGRRSAGPGRGGSGGPPGRRRGRSPPGPASREEEDAAERQRLARPRPGCRPTRSRCRGASASPRAPPCAPGSGRAGAGRSSGR